MDGTPHRCLLLHVNPLPAPTAAYNWVARRQLCCAKGDWEFSARSLLRDFVIWRMSHRCPTEAHPVWLRHFGTVTSPSARRPLRTLSKRPGAAWLGIPPVRATTLLVYFGALRGSHYDGFSATLTAHENGIREVGGSWQVYRSLSAPPHRVQSVHHSTQNNN